MSIPSRKLSSSDEGVEVIMNGHKMLLTREAANDPNALALLRGMLEDREKELVTEGEYNSPSAINDIADEMTDLFMEVLQVQE